MQDYAFIQRMSRRILRKIHNSNVSEFRFCELIQQTKLFNPFLWRSAAMSRILALLRKWEFRREELIRATTRIYLCSHPIFLKVTWVSRCRRRKLKASLTKGCGSRTDHSNPFSNPGSRVFKPFWGAVATILKAIKNTRKYAQLMARSCRVNLKNREI